MSKYGYKKVYWNEIKEQIKNTNIDFYNLVEEINVSSYPLYIINFPFGKLIGDEISQFLPNPDGSVKRLTDSDIPREIAKDLGYGIHTSPLAMILNKKFEWYVDLPKKGITLPTLIKKPGDFFSYTKVLNIKNKFNYSPMGVLSAISGARSVFLLPSIGCTHKFSKLNRSIKKKLKHPKDLFEHHTLFETLTNATQTNEPWYSSIIYFSEKWIANIKNNKDWFKLRQYFYELYAKECAYNSNLNYYNTAYSLLLEEINRKPNPYLFDTFKHLMDITSGQKPGFAPLTDDSLIPIKTIQEVFMEYYGFKDIAPTLIGPSMFNIESENPLPTYYSLQLPTTHSFFPDSKNTSTMVALKLLKEISDETLPELTKENGFCSNTIIQYIAKNINFSFYHNSEDIDGEINDVSELIQKDSRFYYDSTQKNNAPAEDAKFLRGCISISRKKSNEKVS